MPDIHYVVLSDLHLGAENSILTHLKHDSTETDISIPSAAAAKLAACARALAAKNKGTRKPTLVFNGDLMELALTTTNKAIMAFQRTIELLMPEGTEPLFDNEILFLPGNHDHNLWERSRSHYYVECLKKESLETVINEEVSNTRLIDPDPVPAELLTAVIQRYTHLKDFFVSINYPARAIISENKERCIIFCHGHFVESIYSLMTTLRSHIFPGRKKPATLIELEKENYAWIDFFWSTLGRSGSVGRDINLIYDKMQDPTQIRTLLHNIASSYAQTKKHFLSRWAEHHLLEELLVATVGRLATSERNEPEVALTPDATAGLKQLLEVFLLAELKEELGENMPDDIAFIFGHTHKPFQRAVKYEGFNKDVKIYNSGGWVVDTLKQQPLHGGSIILASEDLEVLAVQMYREGKRDITVEQLEGSDKSFFNHVNKIIDVNSEPWSGFAKEAEKAIAKRHGVLAEIIASDN